MRRRAGRLGLVAVTVIAVLGAVLPAHATLAAPEVRVTGRSGYSTCDTPAEGPGDKVQVQAEVEPRVAVNPANPNNLVGVWQQDRWISGAAHGLVAAASFDGGTTWRGSKLPFSKCAPGGVAYERASDPWVSIGPDGTVYAVGLSVSGAIGDESAIVTAVSTDGGRTWIRRRTVKADAVKDDAFNDKESITADPVHAGTAYVVWDRAAFGNFFEVRQPALFSKTTDGGSTWSTPKAIAANGANEVTVGNELVVDPNTGTLYDFYSYDGASIGRTEIRFVKSTDGGATWSAPTTVNTLRSVGVRHPVTGEVLRTEDFAADVTIDPATGALYVAWQDARLNDGRRDEIVMSRSTNGGASWSRIVKVSSRVKRPAFTPTIAVNGSGRVGVTYFDLRFMKKGDASNLRTDYWLRTSDDGGRTWHADEHVSGPFNMRAAPVTERGFFIGDYMGLTHVNDDFVAFYVRTNCVTGTCNRNRTDVYASRVAQ